MPSAIPSLLVWSAPAASRLNSLKSGIVALFDGRIEGVHVDVDDPANPLLVHQEDATRFEAC